MFRSSLATFKLFQVQATDEIFLMAVTVTLTLLGWQIVQMHLTKHLSRNMNWVECTTDGCLDGFLVLGPPGKRASKRCGVRQDANRGQEATGVSRDTRNERDATIIDFLGENNCGRCFLRIATHSVTQT